ncbi:MAG: acyl-CoA reductase, partial [Betaproteobacteria bacterium]|nr:acyl-CoA reductase [Betaproteobacteria bacterium]
ELQLLAEPLALAGVTRLCALGSMTSPEPGWHHDGRFSLLDLVRMVDLEASAESAAESYASYRD